MFFFLQKQNNTFFLKKGECQNIQDKTPLTLSNACRVEGAIRQGMPKQMHVGTV